MSLQKSEEKDAKSQRKRRSEVEKLGKYRYLNRKVDRLTLEVKKLRLQQAARFRILFNRLQPFLAELDSEYVVSVVCSDEGDVALLDYLRSKGNLGISPSEACAAKELSRFAFKPYHITRRIQRMNSQLKKELGKPLAESYNRRWVMTSFVLEAFSKSKEELESEEPKDDKE